MAKRKADTMTGICRYCGQVHAVVAEDQPEADRLAIESCNCEGAIRHQRRKEAVEKIELLNTLPEDQTGFRPVSEELCMLLKALGEKMADGKLDNVAMTAEGRRISMKLKADTIRIAQQKTVKSELEC